ncbi:MAG: hypothetical protein CL912_23265 [Deltaproteobacteria bacterium]|nr:hypothetical protein [Deltaproteobacteria bacterium]
MSENHPFFRQLEAEGCSKKAPVAKARVVAEQLDDDDDDDDDDDEGHDEFHDAVYDPVCDEDDKFDYSAHNEDEGSEDDDVSD